MFSLCIPTMDRFDTFLEGYLEKYMQYDLIDEIVITDENGNDLEKIKKKYNEHPKLVLIKNERQLGPFLNKLKACKIAKNEWVVLIDSDNFADETYFSIAKKYIDENLNNNDNNNVILAPSFAKPNFNYTHFSGTVFNKEYFRKNSREAKQSTIVLMNTGNYIINKYLIDNLNIENELENIGQSPSCDVIYFNTLLFEQLDLHLHVVPNLEYNHVHHSGNTYTLTHRQFEHFSRIVHERFYNL